MARIEELLPEFRKGAKIRCKSWKAGEYIYIDKKGSSAEIRTALSGF